jgi:hypothetical protein
MRYVLKVPFEVSAPLSESDPDVRSISRLPGFVRLELVDRDNSRYELEVEVEGGSLRDAADAAEELLVDYESALGAYRPRLLAGLAPQPR